LTFRGKVGINTETPSEALTVNGNVLVSGNVLKPSDKRIKDNITPVDTKVQLQNLTNLKIYDYDLKQWKDVNGTTTTSTLRDRGVLAQELNEIIPQAVEKIGDVELQDGKIVQNLLVVNERVLLFENIGATQELCRIIQEEIGTVDHIDDRVDRLERGENSRKTVQNDTRSTLENLIDFVTSEEYITDPDQSNCCYCSVFGLGPAWTTFIFGMFCPLIWMVGILYIGSVFPVRRKAGLANLTAVAIYILGILAITYIPPLKGFVFLVTISPVLFGLAVMIFLGCLMRKKSYTKMDQRSKARYKLRQYMSRPKFYSYSRSNDSEPNSSKPNSDPTTAPASRKNTVTKDTFAKMV